jgi:HisJ family histidinol phosphate phosphatase
MKDYHLHTNFADGQNSIDEMVTAAKVAGFEGIAITEHLTWFFAELGRAKITISPHTADEYFNQCREAEQKHGLRVLSGFEIGYLERDEEATKVFLAKVKPDILLLSVHHLELLKDFTRADGREDKAGYSVYMRGETGAELVRQYGCFKNVCDAYFQHLYRALDAGFQDLAPLTIVSHLNVFANDPSADPVVAAPFLDEAIQIIASKKLPLEVNYHYSNGSPKNNTRPPLSVAKRFLQLGGKAVYFGSDSHSVEELIQKAKFYQDFERAVKI